METAGQVQVSQQLQRRRTNLATTLEVLSAMEGIAQAQQALQGLLPQAGGVGVDYAGAIDVLEVLQGVLDNQDILSLDCFRCGAGGGGGDACLLRVDTRAELSRPSTRLANALAGASRSRLPTRRRRWTTS